MKKKLPADKQSVGIYVRFTPAEGAKLAKIAGKGSIASIVREAVISIYRL